jgi:perosamine synthetase
MIRENRVMHQKIGVGYAFINEAGKKYVQTALDESRLSPGEYVYRFEKEFAQLHNQKYGIACNSGTSALHAALEALKEKYEIPEHSEVLVPAVTFIATANACLQARLKPVFVDVDPLTYNINPDLLAEKVTHQTAAVIPVHLFGQPCQMERISEIAARHGLKVLEDCAEAHFAKYQGQPVGSFGLIAGYSTYVAHTITTGIGGIITTNDRQLSEICRSLIAHGRACTCEKCMAANPEQVCQLRTETDFDKRFTFVRLGYSYRIGELEGALGVAQLEAKDAIIGARQANAAYLSERLQPYADWLQLPFYPEYVEHSFMMYPLVVKTAAPFTRKELTAFLESGNIETRPMLPIINQPVYQELFQIDEAQFPVARWINRNGFYLGCHHGLARADLDYIVERIDAFYKQFLYTRSMS